MTLAEIREAANRVLADEQAGLRADERDCDAYTLASFVDELLHMAEPNRRLEMWARWAAETAGADVGCPEHPDTCDGTSADCCCADRHRTWAALSLLRASESTSTGGER